MTVGVKMMSAFAQHTVALLAKSCPRRNMSLRSGVPCALVATSGTWRKPSSAQISAVPASRPKSTTSGRGSRRVQLSIALRWITANSPVKGFGVDRMVSIAASSDRGGEFRVGRVLQVPAVGVLDALAQWRRVRPTEIVEATDVEQLPGCPVGLGGVEVERRGGVHDVANGLGELTDGEVVAGPDVDVHLVLVVVHQEEARVGEVVDVEEL